MKKLMIALCLVGSLCAFSQEGAPKPEGGDRPQMLQEQRKAMREKFQVQMKARRAATQAKVVGILTAAGLDEAKAKDVADQIEKTYMAAHPGRRPGGPGAGGQHGRRPGARKAPGDKAPAAEAKEGK